MLKRFFVSFLGTLAGIWVSVIMVGLAIFLGLMLALAGAAMGDDTSGNVKTGTVLCLDLGTYVVEYNEELTLQDVLLGNSGTGMSLARTVAALDAAAADKNVEVLYIHANGISAGMAQLQTLREAVQRFRDAGKKVVSYGDNYSQGDYYIASVADSIFVNPVGSIDVHGIQSQGLYFKGLLDRLGVEMQVVKVGTYKSAVEPFLLNGPSEANIEQQRVYIGGLWSVLRSQMANARGVTPETVDAWVEAQSGTKSASWYLDERLADGTKYYHEMLETLAAMTGNDDPDIVDVASYTYKPSQKGDTRVAVYYLEGDIVDDGIGGIVGPDVTETILDIAEEEDIKALVLRVNSGGGSAFASEQIWEAVETYKAMTGNPVYVSMGDYAASGGYYISCGADKIFAQATTLTGSIGIFGLIPNAQGLLTDKLGIRTHTVSSNPGAEEPITPFRAMTPAQRSAMQANVDRGYELFTRRVAEGRALPLDSVKAIAEGRVWDGMTALHIGLVDNIGGLDVTLNALAEELGEEHLKVKRYPAPGSKWWKELMALQGMRERLVEAELGDDAYLYRAVRSLRTQAPVQARMPYEIVIF